MNIDHIDDEIKSAQADAYVAEWEERRFEVAKDAFCIILQEYPNSSEVMAQNAVSYADALIAELKKQSK